MAELTAPFVVKNDEKRIVYGPVLVPDEPDTDDDVVTAEQIEKVSHQFVEQYGNIDLQHSLNNVGKMVESYILPMDWEVDENVTVPKGSWMLGVRVTDDDAWKLVKDQKLGGFSIMGIAKAAMKSKEATAEKNAAEKRTTLADLGDDFIVNAVSLVDEPAVPKAKWISIKSKAKQEEVTDETVQKAIEGSLEHRRRLVSSKIDEIFERYDRTALIHSTLEDSVVFRLADHNTETTKTFQIGYEINNDGEVTFTGEPQEVRIEESIVPVSTGGGLKSNPDTGGDLLDNKDQSGIESADKSDDGVFSKLMKKLGFQSSEKAGRTISDSNLKKLRAAKEVIDDLLAVGEKERESSNKAEEGEEMNEQEIKELVKKEMEPVNSKLDDVLSTLKAEAKDDDKPQNETEENKFLADHAKQEDDSDGDGISDEQATEQRSTEDPTEEQQEENSKDKTEKGKEENNELESVLKELEKYKKRNQPFSKRIAGQDNMTEKKKIEDDRNAFGYKKR